jgi:hypothetical protein
VPEITTKKRSFGRKCGRLMLPGSHLFVTLIPPPSEMWAVIWGVK